MTSPSLPIDRGRYIQVHHASYELKIPKTLYNKFEYNERNRSRMSVQADDLRSSTQLGWAVAHTAFWMSFAPFIAKTRSTTKS